MSHIPQTLHCPLGSEACGSLSFSSPRLAPRLRAFLALISLLIKFIKARVCWFSRIAVLHDSDFGVLDRRRRVRLFFFLSSPPSASYVLRTSAKFVWKRIPEQFKLGKDVHAAWKIGKAMWNQVRPILLVCRPLPLTFHSRGFP